MSFLQPLAGVSSEMIPSSDDRPANCSAEALYRALYAQAPDVCVSVEPDSGRILHANHAVCASIGFSPRELAGRSILTLAHPENPPAARRHWEAIARCSDLRDVDIQVQRKDGGKAEMSASASAIRGEAGRILCGLTVWRDISRRKHAEQTLLAQQRQFRTLAYELAVAEERERRRIAAGLHDEIGQLLAIAKLKLGELGAAPAREDSSRLVDELRALVDQAVRATRSTTFELSSPVLHQLGLEAAVESLGQRVARMYGLRFHFESDDTRLPLPEETQVVLFRVVRELLFNVHKHARARHVTVTFRRNGDHALIRVEDDGIGFKAGKLVSELSPSGGFGLFSVSAQVQAFGGLVEIDSCCGAGTRVIISAPLPVSPGG